MNFSNLYQTVSIPQGVLEVPECLNPSPALNTRGISAETCALYRVYSTGKPLEIVSEFVDDDGKTCGYHYRSGGWLNVPGHPEKRQRWAPGSKRSLFGYHLWLEANCPMGIDVCLCEGQTDAMAASQAMPGVLCLALAGKPSAELWHEWMTQLRSMLGTVGTLWLAFDSDEQGIEYRDYVDEHYDGKKQSLLLGPHKDLCELLLNGGTLQWEQLPKLSSEIVSAVSVNDEMRTGGVAFTPGLSVGWGELDQLCSGFYPGSLLMIAAPAKAGKSSFVNDLVVRYIQKHNQPVMYLPLEMTVREVQTLLGASILGVPVESTDSSAVFDAVDTIADKLFWVQHFGRILPKNVNRWFRDAKLLGVKLVVIDPIQASTAATGDAESATVALDGLMYHISHKLMEYGLSGVVVSHVNTARPEERIDANGLRGSRGLSQIATCVLGVQRLDDGASNVYVIVPDRRYGRYGDVVMTYSGHRFKPVKRKGAQML